MSFPVQDMVIAEADNLFAQEACKLPDYLAIHLLRATDASRPSRRIWIHKPVHNVIPFAITTV